MSGVDNLLYLRESDGISKLRKRIFQEIPQLGKVACKQEGRELLIDEKRVYDFASCNYLGLDLHPKVIASILPAIEKWGVHPSWTCIVCSPDIYRELEVALADLIGAPSVLLFQTITLIHEGVIPILARQDSVILMDRAAHRSIYEACRLAHDGGAEFVQTGHDDLEELERHLQKYQDKAVKLIAIDGVYSMSGDYPNLPEYVRLAKKYDAVIYIDDAHGFGVVGERPSPERPYGHKGNGIVRYFGLKYDEDNIIYVSGLSKAYSALGAFITCPPQMRELLSTASTYIFSGPCPVASLASALKCVEVNREEGDDMRDRIYRLTHKLIAEARSIGFEVDNRTYFPIVTVMVGSPKTVIAACRMLWQEIGILITPAMFPAVPINKGAMRFTITAANTEEQVDYVIVTLKKIWEMMKRKKTENIE